jgi:hypothetical protein
VLPPQEVTLLEERLSGACTVVEVAAFGKDKAEATMSGTLQAGNEDMGAGEEISGVSSPFDGVIDEIRISTVVRPDAWLKATYGNLSAPTSFLYSGPGNRKVEVVRRRRPAAYRHDDLHLRSARLHRQLVDLPLGLAVLYQRGAEQGRLVPPERNAQPVVRTVGAHG